MQISKGHLPSISKVEAVKWTTHQPEISKAFQLCAPADQKFIMCYLCAKREYIQTADMLISKYFMLSGGYSFSQRLYF